MLIRAAAGLAIGVFAIWRVASVLAQDTGLDRLYPTDEGLITFTTVEEAIAGVEEITNHYERHARAARAIAEQYFDSDRVLARLLDKLGVG